MTSSRKLGYGRGMSRDAKESLILVGSVLAFVGLFFLSMFLFRWIDVPEPNGWFWLLVAILLVVDFRAICVRFWGRPDRSGRAKPRGDE